MIPLFKSTNMNELFIQNWAFTGKGFGVSLDDILKSKFLYYGVPFVDPCDPTGADCVKLPLLPPNSTGAGVSPRTVTHFNAAVQTLLDRITDLEARVTALEP